MARRYNTYEVCDVMSDLSNTEESDISDSGSEYLPEHPEPEDSDDCELSLDSEDSAKENNDAESNSDSSDAHLTTNQ